MILNAENYDKALANVEGELSQLTQSPNENIQETFKNIKTDFDEFRNGADKLLKDNKVLKIGVVGQVKAGKSSFLNSLFFDGENVLPRASTPMTAGLTVLEYGEQNEFSVDYYNEREWNTFEGQAKLYDQQLEDYKKQNPQSAAFTDEEIAKMIGIDDKFKAAKELVNSCSGAARGKIQEKSVVDTKSFADIRDLQDILSDYVGADGRYTPVVKSLTIKLNDDRLKDLRIVDTPGVNDPIQSREYRTREFLRECHGVFLLSYAGRFFDSTDVSFLSGRIGSQGIGTVVLVASKFDSVLQDEGSKYNDDLIGAWEDCESKLKKQFRSNLAKSDYKGDEPRFTVSSGIGYSIFKKPRERWDTVEAHVVKQMQRFYPSNFSNDEDIKSTFLNLANMDEIREKYLDGVFVKNRDKIIQSKMDGYFANATSNLTKEITKERSGLVSYIKNLESSDISEIKAIEKATRGVVNKLCLEINTLANVCDDKVDKVKKNTWNQVSFSWNNVIPTTEETIFGHRKSTFWGSDKSFEASCRKVDTQKLISILADDFKKTASELSKKWDDGSEEILKAINDKIASIIAEAEQQDEEGHVPADVLRAKLSEVIAKMDNARTLNLKNIVNKAVGQITDIAQDCVVETSFGSMDEGEARSKIRQSAEEQLNKVRGEVRRVCDGLNSEFETALEKSKDALADVFKSRKNELVDKATENINEYLKQLDSDLKSKEERLAQYKEAVNQIDKISKQL
jgi:hypothetical protein